MWPVARYVHCQTPSHYTVRKVSTQFYFTLLAPPAPAPLLLLGSSVTAMTIAYIITVDRRVKFASQGAKSNEQRD
jgi:hypothetical protein